MKQILKNRLDKLPNLEDRVLLKQILNSVFSELVDYTNEELDVIKERVFTDIEDDVSKFNVYYDLTSKDEFDPISEMYFPIEESDLVDGSDFEELTLQIKKNNQAILARVYLNCDFIKINRFIKTSTNRKFRGRLSTTKKEVPVSVGVRPYKGYVDQIEQLYINFIGNDLPWKTILHPHLSKFIEVSLETKISLEDDERITQVEWDLEEMKPYQQIEMVPLWNIKRFDVKNESFPVPASDHINYEHSLNIEKYGAQHGYLVNIENENVSYVKKTARDLTIISMDERVPKWELFQFIQPRRADILTLQKSNHQEIFFTDRFARRENHTVRSMCEISRIINTYTMITKMTLEQIEIVESYNGVIETYEVNSFIEDNIRNEKDKSFMVLRFRVIEQHQTIRDEISFLVSEIQLHFPDFKCVGEIL